MSFTMLVAVAVFFAASVVAVFEMLEIQPFDVRRIVGIFVGVFLVTYLGLVMMVM